MRTGKLPEEVLKRSVLQTIGHRRSDVLAGPAVGADCAVLRTEPGEVLVFSSDPITGAVNGIGSHSIHITANDLAAAGARPVAVLLTLLLPETVTEDEILAMMTDAERVCASLDMEIIGGHTEITPVVRQPVISVTGIGRQREDERLRPENVRSGQDIVVSKWIGLEASAILAAEYADRMRGSVPAETVRTAQSFSDLLSVVPEAMAARKAGVVLMHDITEGGILGALWEVAEAGGVGLNIDAHRIPVRRETEEICRFFALDPYRVMSSGSLMMIAEDGCGLVQTLERAGIKATVIGHTTEDGRRCLRDGDLIRPVESPGPDELYRVISELS